MSRYDYGYGAYVSVAEKRAKAERQIEKLRKKNPNLAPVEVNGRTLASSWWGKAWNRNLESYADYENRISRGKSYVRSRAVLDLQIEKGAIHALVQGSGARPYKIEVAIDTLDAKRWGEIVKLCNYQIDSVEQLALGKFPSNLEVLFQERKYGLFPSPKEIHFSCSCPDYARMCKHVAAVLYGVGTRLDAEPLLLFELRGVEIRDLIRRSVEKRMEDMLKNAGKKSGRSIPDREMHDLFGI